MSHLSAPHREPRLVELADVCGGEVSPESSVPAAASLDWRSRGSCRGVDPMVFYGPDRERAAARRRRVAKAKAICQSCPVRTTCLTQSLEYAEPYGVWGGTTSDERSSILEQSGKRADH
ncbi:WhiB family transcriptional regulator [Mycolicibacterium houstonense]|uniref:WhiB family transcriptional regulator n=1 Tax=Mycolicibacterium houstonense TaxID=146021 RepID=UPI003F96A282